MNLRFRDRSEAGRLLAEKLKAYAQRDDVLVLALPRGGVPVGFEIARALDAPLDVLIVRELGLPQQPEFAIGALASGGACVFNQSLLAGSSLATPEIKALIAREQSELERRERAYRGQRPFPELRGRTVILVDDGMATGATMHAAVKALQTQQPAHLVIAVPVAAAETCAEFAQMQNHTSFLCLLAPVSFHAVGLWYESFPQMTDDEVRSLLERAAQLPAPSTAHTSPNS